MSLLLVLFQIRELKRTLHTQAEGVLTLAGHCQQLYAAHMQLIDLMPDFPPIPTNGSCEELTTDATGNVRTYIRHCTHDMFQINARIECSVLYSVHVGVPA